ncbi:MAG: hypothetical protein AAB961_01710, partial [Patescibacteria group bacterium]
FEECTNFAVAAGFMDAKDAEMARKTGGKGPGGCKSKESCDAFCNDPANQETCFQFGVDNGMIPQEDLQRMKEGKQQMQQALTQAPPAVMDCLNSSVGSEALQKMQSGAGMPPRDVGDKMKTCFEKMGPPTGAGGPGEGGNMPPGVGDQGQGRGQQGQGPNFQGPGGCKTPEECKSLCESNPEACKNFGPGGQEGQNGIPQGMMPPGFAAPRGEGGSEGGAPCKSQEECAKLFGSDKIPEGMMKQGSEGFQQKPMEQQMQQFKTMMPQGIPTQDGAPNSKSPQSIMEQYRGTIQGVSPMYGGEGGKVPLQQMQQQAQQQMQQFMQPPTGQQPQQQFTPPPSGAPSGGSSGGGAMTPPSGPAPAPSGGSIPPPPTSVNLQNLFGQLQKAFSSFIIR